MQNLGSIFQSYCYSSGLCLGMSLEELQSSEDSSINADDIITCYECASDIAMWLMSGQKTTSSLVIPPLPGEMGSILEVAVQRAPILHIKAGYCTIFHIILFNNARQFLTYCTIRYDLGISPIVSNGSERS